MTKQTVKRNAKWFRNCNIICSFEVSWLSVTHGIMHWRYTGDFNCYINRLMSMAATGHDSRNCRLFHIKCSKIWEPHSPCCLRGSRCFWMGEVVTSACIDLHNVFWHLKTARIGTRNMTRLTRFSPLRSSITITNDRWL